MMIDAGIEEELRQKLWAETANIAADLDNILVINKNNKNAYELFYNKPSPKFAFNLKRFGEVGYIVLRQGNQEQDQQQRKERNNGQIYKAKHRRHLQDV